LEKRGELEGVKEEEELGGLPSTRVKKVSANPKLPHFFDMFFVFFSSLSYSFTTYIHIPRWCYFGFYVSFHFWF